MHITCNFFDVHMYVCYQYRTLVIFENNFWNHDRKYYGSWTIIKLAKKKKTIRFFRSLIQTKKEILVLIFVSITYHSLLKFIFLFNYRKLKICDNTDRYRISVTLILGHPSRSVHKCTKVAVFVWFSERALFHRWLTSSRSIWPSSCQHKH